MGNHLVHLDQKFTAAETYLARNGIDLTNPSVLESLSQETKNKLKEDITGILQTND